MVKNIHLKVTGWFADGIPAFFQEISGVIAFATVLRTNKTIVNFNIERQLLFTHQEEQTVHMWEMLCVRYPSSYLSSFRVMPTAGQNQLASV